MRQLTMAVDVNDEILQDFLIEAGEILEQLNEQLVDLEQRPDDYDLLNAVFRGFHTIKGGAGFLNIEALVVVCHRAEDVFNVLRQGQRKVDPSLMDTVLRVLDTVNEMFERVQSGEDPEPADAELIGELQLLATAQPEQDDAPEVTEEDPSKKTETPQIPAEDNDAEISEDEFESLLDQLHGPGQHGGVPASRSVMQEQSSQDGEPGDITEAEFETLLDQLHGPGKHGGVPQAEKPAAEPSEEITEAEFDQLLDKIHGKGSFGRIEPRVVAEETAATANTPVASGNGQRQAVRTPSVGNPQPAKSGDKKPTSSADATVRVDTARLDDIMNMVGELVLVRNRLATLKAKLGDEDVANAVANLDLVTSDLQNSVMKTRMQPVKKVFGRFPRVVRDLARSLGKKIELEMYGESTDLDKNLIEALADPMVHLVRNAVDHGIEMPEERVSAGKPAAGKVVLSAAQEGDHILLAITDDGRGMDADVLRHKAVDKGMMDWEAAERLDDKECFNLIFHPGFSTKSEISDVSGRGVGMDVVKTGITRMNGSVGIDSELGKGSRITIKLPLTLAILPTLMVVLGNQPFALPLTSVVEIFNLDLRRTNTVDGQLTIMVRERALPLFYLHQWLINDADEFGHGSKGHVVVVNVGNVQAGLVVDYLIGQEEVVIKPLGALLQGLDGMAGATITGDGKIALILDVPGLLRKYVRRY
jgi:two-component system chemotaxis sensor kinase CheA